jgi:hypothetical protein
VQVVKPDVLFFDTVGAPFTSTSILSRGTGGSELEIARIATALANRGHSVVVANNVDKVEVCNDDVAYVPHAMAAELWPSKALVITRYSVCPHIWGSPTPKRVAIRATDLACDAYGHHRVMLETSRATLMALTTWHANMFDYAKERVVIPMPLGPTNDSRKRSGRFVYGSGPVKGLSATIKKWTEMHDKYPELKGIELVLMSPGWGEWPFSPGFHDKDLGIRFIGTPTPAEYQDIVASAEGLFFVNTFTETFCCLAALAERDRTRTHILCKSGFGGIPEALVNHTLLTDDEEKFERLFMEAYRDPTNEKWYADHVVDRSADVLALEWEKALWLK